MDTLTAVALSAAAAPGLLGFALPRLLGWDARASRRAAAAGACLALVLALAAAALFLQGGPARGALLWLDLAGLRVSLGAQVDGLTALMLVTVTVIGATVSRYAIRYLDGDPGQARFCQWISYTLSSVLVLAVSSNLLIFFAGWVGSSHGLHRLLTHRSERPAAWLAARKKFLVSRLGDLMLLAALVLVGRAFGSLEFAEILSSDPAAHPDAAWLGVVALLFVLGAMTKSAQFPFHTWLPDSLETPTPVSALMHAGIINAGGFLLIRMSPLLVDAPRALVPLALGGAFTAMLGSVVMLTQTDIKRKYAWSTVAQMGFMMLQCGLGAFAAAALHMVGHAFYKGHAFLAAGSTVDPLAPGRRPAPASRPGASARVLLAVAAGAGVVVGALLLLGLDPAGKPGLAVLGSVLTLAIAQLLLGSAAPWRWATVLPPLATGAGIAVLYFAGVGLFEGILGDAIPAASGTPGGMGVAVALLLPFVFALLLQERATHGRADRWLRVLYVHAHNGFYLGTLQDRLVSNLWPLPKRSPEHGEKPSCA